MTDLQLHPLTPSDVRRMRIILRMDVKALADAMGVTERTVWRWEDGTRQMPGPSARLLVRMAEEGRLAAQAR